MDLVGLVAVLGAFAVPLYALKTRHDAKMRELAAKNPQAQLAAGKQAQQAQLLLEENKLLRERVENLESIVCSVDFDLNKKLAKVIDEQRSLLLPPAANGPQPPAALDRTATAHGAGQSGPAPALSTTLEPGQVLAQRYRVQRLL